MRKLRPWGRLAVAAVIGLGMATAATAPASAADHAQPPGVSAIQPDLANGTYNIVEANGNHAVGAATLDTGQPVIEVTGLGRIMTFVRQTAYSGDDAGLVSFSSGNVLAMNNLCTKAVIKAPSATFGTVWAFKFTGITHTYWVISRGCDQAFGSPDTISLAGFDNTNAQFTSCGSPPQNCGGLFLKMTLPPA